VLPRGRQHRGTLSLCAGSRIYVIVVLSRIIMRRDGFSVFVLLPVPEYRPAHVHVRKGDGEVVIRLPNGAVHSASGMTSRDVAAARRLVLATRDYLIRFWRVYDDDATQARY
jgi:hypothetical protein